MNPIYRMFHHFFSPLYTRAKCRCSGISTCCDSFLHSPGWSVHISCISHSAHLFYCSSIPRHLIKSSCNTRNLPYLQKGQQELLGLIPPSLAKILVTPTFVTTRRGGRRVQGRLLTNYVFNAILQDLDAQKKGKEEMNIKIKEEQERKNRGKKSQSSQLIRFK